MFMVSMRLQFIGFVGMVMNIVCGQGDHTVMSIRWELEIYQWLQLGYIYIYSAELADPSLQIVLCNSNLQNYRGK